MLWSKPSSTSFQISQNRLPWGLGVPNPNVLIGSLPWRFGHLTCKRGSWYIWRILPVDGSEIRLTTWGWLKPYKSWDNLNHPWWCRISSINSSDSSAVFGKKSYLKSDEDDHFVGKQVLCDKNATPGNRGESFLKAKKAPFFWSQFSASETSCFNSRFWPKINHMFICSLQGFSKLVNSSGNLGKAP